MLGLGVVFNMIRGIWLGAQQQGVWVLSSGGSVVGAGWGAIDGLLFALAGFGFAFGILFVMWLLGQAAGGDLKLCAALGAWVGVKYFFFVLIGTGILVVVIGVVQMIRLVVLKGPRRAFFRSRGPAGKGRPAVGHHKDRLLAYALPLALSTAILLPLLLRTDLRLQPSPPAETAQAAARQ
jgi:Flp pilus assembly protein protease CpaA